MSSSPTGPIKSWKMQYACSTCWPLYSVWWSSLFFSPSVQHLQHSLYLCLSVSPRFFGERERWCRCDSSMCQVLHLALDKVELISLEAPTVCLDNKQMLTVKDCLSRDADLLLNKAKFCKICSVCVVCVSLKGEHYLPTWWAPPQWWWVLQLSAEQPGRPPPSSPHLKREHRTHSESTTERPNWHQCERLRGKIKGINWAGRTAERRAGEHSTLVSVRTDPQRRREPSLVLARSKRVPL